MKMYESRLKCHWSLFPSVRLTIFHHWFRWWLGADKATSHYLSQWWFDYRRIYASLGLNELNFRRRLQWVSDAKFIEMTTFQFKLISVIYVQWTSLNQYHEQLVMDIAFVSQRITANQIVLCPELPYIIITAANYIEIIASHGLCGNIEWWGGRVTRARVAHFTCPSLSDIPTQECS